MCGVTCLPAEDSGLLHLVYSCAAEKHSTAPCPSHGVPIFPRKANVMFVMFGTIQGSNNPSFDAAYYIGKASSSALADRRSRYRMKRTLDLPPSR